MGRPDLYAMFSKVELWRQLQYKQLVYIDADAIALRAPDELLEMETSFAAAPDVGWPDCFNSGMMVLRPNLDDYNAMMEMAESGTSFDGADQGLLNMHFKNWDRLSFTLNCTPSAHYQYVPAFRHFQNDISIVHFIGSRKPWQLPRDGGISGTPYQELLGHWWTVYDRHYRPKSQEELSRTQQNPQSNHTEPVSEFVESTSVKETPQMVASKERADKKQSAPSTAPPPYEQHQEDRKVISTDKHVEHPFSARPTGGHNEEDWIDDPQGTHHDSTPANGPEGEPSHPYQIVEGYHPVDATDEDDTSCDVEDLYTEECRLEDPEYQEETPTPAAYEEPPPLSIVPQYVYGEQHVRIPQVKRRPPAIKSMNQRQQGAAGTTRSASGRGRLSFQEGIQDQPKRFMKQRAFSPHPLASRNRRVDNDARAIEQKTQTPAPREEVGRHEEQLPPWYPPKPKFMPPMSEWNPTR